MSSTTSSSIFNPILSWKRMVLLGIALFAVFNSGCSTTSHVMLGDARDPVSESEVKFYLDPPHYYQEIAMITSHTDGIILASEPKKIRELMDGLKKQAAALGANGVLIKGMIDPTKHTKSRSEVADQSPRDTDKSLWALAIFVSEQQPRSLLSLISDRSPFGRSEIVKK